MGPPTPPGRAPLLGSKEASRASNCWAPTQASAGKGEGGRQVTGDTSKRQSGRDTSGPKPKPQAASETRPTGGSMVSIWKSLGQVCSRIQNSLDFARVIGYLYYAKTPAGSGTIFIAFWI